MCDEIYVWNISELKQDLKLGHAMPVLANQRSLLQKALHNFFVNSKKYCFHITEKNFDQSNDFDLRKPNI